MQVLQIDRAGLPVQWLSLERAATYHAKGSVAWSVGETCAVFRGGTNAQSGLESVIELKPIIAVEGETRQKWLWREPPLSRKQVFRRDRLTCAYCGNKFREDELTLDHIHPESRGGLSTWTNLVSACRRCNGHKDAMTPEEAGMPLLFLPYVPSLHESFILENRAIIADQMEWLCAAVPEHSRVRLH